MTPFGSCVSLPGCSAERGGEPAFVCCYNWQALPLMRASGCRDVLVIQVSHLERLSWYNIISGTRLPLCLAGTSMSLCPSVWTAPVLVCLYVQGVV